MGINTEDGMRKLTVSIPDDLDELLRKYVDDHYEGIKGGLSIVVKNAIRDFLEKERRT